MQTLIANPVKHYVYIIRKQTTKNGKISCKIGYTKDAEQRKKGLQTGNDYKLQIVKTFHVANDSATADRIEKQIQRMFKDFKMVGEWYHFNPVYLANVAIPQIMQFVKTLNVQDIPTPSERVATREMTKQEYLALKIELAKLNNKMSRGQELEFFEQAQRKQIVDALAEEANREKALSKLKHLKIQEKRRAYKEKRAKEQRAFHYLAYIMR